MTAGLSAAGGATVWFTGLPSGGKTTLACALADQLAKTGRRSQILDGDQMRSALCADLGFSKEDRITNVRRIGFVASLLATHGVFALAPVIAPFALARAEVARLHAERGVAYLEVHVSTPLNVCVMRDAKGLYARQARGEIKGLTGIDDPYEAPVSPHLAIDTSSTSVEQCVEALLDLLKRHKLM